MNTDPERLRRLAEQEDGQPIAVGGLMHKAWIEENVGGVRDFIYRITQEDASSPIAEAEIEEIARCALAGGYKFNVEAFMTAFGRFKLNMPYE